MGEIDVKTMTKEQLIKIVKDQGEKIDALETKIQSATDFIDGVKAGQVTKQEAEDEDW